MPNQTIKVGDTLYSFPADMSDEAIQTALQKELGQATQDPPESNTIADGFGRGLDNLAALGKPATWVAMGKGILDTGKGVMDYATDAPNVRSAAQAQAGDVLNSGGHAGMRLASMKALLDVTQGRIPSNLIDAYNFGKDKKQADTQAAIGQDPSGAGQRVGNLIGLGAQTPAALSIAGAAALTGVNAANNSKNIADVPGNVTEALTTAAPFLAVPTVVGKLRGNPAAPRNAPEARVNSRIVDEVNNNRTLVGAAAEKWKEDFGLDPANPHNASVVLNNVQTRIAKEAKAILKVSAAEQGISPDAISAVMKNLKAKNFSVSSTEFAEIQAVFGKETVDKLAPYIEEANSFTKNYNTAGRLVSGKQSSPIGTIVGGGGVKILDALRNKDAGNLVNRIYRSGGPGAAYGTEGRAALTKWEKIKADRAALEVEQGGGVDTFDPTSQSVIDSASYGNPDILRNSVPPPADYFPTSGITDDARRALAKVETMRRLADPKSKTVAAVDGGDLPTVATDPTSVGKTLPPPKAIRPYKIAAENLDAPALLSGYGARGALANTLFQDTGIHATNRQVNTALKSAMRIVKAKTDPAEWAAKRATLKDPTNLDPELYDQAAQSLMKLAGAKQKMGIGSPGNVNGFNEPIYDKNAWAAGKDLIESLRKDGADVVRLPEGGLSVSVVGGPEIGVVKNAAAARSLWEKYLAAQPPK